MKTLTDEQIKLLRSPLPTEAISKHPTKTYLSSIKAIYVVERLNNVFGIGSWHLKSEVIKDSTAMIVVKAIITIPEYNINLESFGGNDNGGETNKNFDLGDAYKGATTDALTKIGSYLEIGIDVFKGLSNNSSSNTIPPKKPYIPNTPNTTYKKPATPVKPINQPLDPKKAKIVNLCKETGMTGTDYKKYVLDKTSVELEEKNFDFIIGALEEIKNLK